MASLANVLEVLIEHHDWTEDGLGLKSGATPLGAQGCGHWTTWGDQLQLDRPVLTVAVEHTPADTNFATALRLLHKTGVPQSWTLLASASPELDRALQGQAVRTLIAALNVRFAELVTSDDAGGGKGLHSAYIFETIHFLDDWCIITDGDHNYIPQWGIERWISDYLNMIDSSCSPEDLRELSAQTHEEMCITEALSTLTDPDQLVAAASTSAAPGPIFAQAPNLPRDFVNDRLNESEYLIFHPKADPDLAWTALEEMLASSPDDVIQLMGPFDNLRNQGWGTVMGYPRTGAHARALRARTRQWCLENPDEGEDLLMEIFEE